MTSPKKYKAVVGLTLEDGKRIEPGKDVPAKVIEHNKWLVKQGKVVEKKTAKKGAK